LPRGVDEVGYRGVPRPLWNASPCAELIANPATSPRSFFCWRWIRGSTSSWYSWANLLCQKKT
jgi:hypothetical protein